MHLWKRLGSYLGIPLTYLLIAHTLTPESLRANIGGLFSIPTAEAMTLRECTIPESGYLNKLGTELEGIIAASDAYNADKTDPNLMAALSKIDALRTNNLPDSFDEGQKQTISNIIEKYKNLRSTTVGSVLTPPHARSTLVQEALEGFCRDTLTSRQEFTDAKKTEVLKYFADSPFFGSNESWGLKAKVEAVLAKCSDKKFLGEPARLGLEGCHPATASQEYDELLALREFLDGKISSNIQVICDTWHTRGTLTGGIRAVGDKTPGDILPVPLSNTQDLAEPMLTLAKTCHDLRFESWYSFDDFKRDITTNTTTDFYETLNPTLTAANSHKMIQTYAKKVARKASLGGDPDWLAPEKFSDTAFWNLDASLPTEFPNAHFKSGDTWFVTGPDLKTYATSFIEALHTLSLQKCLTDHPDKQPSCVAAAKNAQNLPYPFNRDTNPANPSTPVLHPHIALGATAPTGLSAQHALYRVFACQMRGSQQARSAVYDLKYGWPTLPQNLSAAIPFCSSANHITPSTPTPEIRIATLKALPHLLAEGPGALRPASGLVAFHELQRIHSGDTAKKQPDKHLFFMSLGQPKLNPTSSTDTEWQRYINNPEQGLGDINAAAVLAFFGSEMLFMQQGSNIPAIKPLTKPKGKDMDQDAHAWLKKLFGTQAGLLTPPNQLAGQYLNSVRASWVNDMVNPLFHTYQMDVSGRSTWETVSFQGKKSALEKDKRLIDTAVFRLLMGLDPNHPPIVLDTATGEVISFIDWGSSLNEGNMPATMAYVPLFLVDDFHQLSNSPAQGLFPAIGGTGGILGTTAGLTGRRSYGLTPSDVFIRKASATSDQISVLPGSDVISAMQMLNMTVAEVIHRECSLQDEGFSQMMGRIRECKNNPAEPSPRLAAAAAPPSDTAAGTTAPVGEPPPSDPCLPRPGEVMTSALAAGQKPSFDICKAMAVISTHYDSQLKESVPNCRVKKWVPWTECANKQGTVMKWGMRVIASALILQALFMIVYDEKAWFWEWDKWSKTRWQRKHGEDQDKKRAAANIATQTTAQRASSEASASSALGALRGSIKPSYHQRSASSQVRRSRGNVRSTDATKSAGGKGKASANTSKTQRTGTRSLPPGLNFRLGRSR